AGDARPPAAAAQRTPGAVGVLLIVEADQDFAERLSLEAEQRGLNPHVAAGASVAAARYAELAPDVIIASLETLGDDAEHVLAAGGPRRESARLIILSGDAGFDARV